MLQSELRSPPDVTSRGLQVRVSKSLLRKALLFLDTTDRVPERTVVAVGLVDIAEAEAEVEGVAAGRSC